MYVWNILTNFKINDAFQNSHYAVWCHTDICISHKFEYLGKEEIKLYKYSTKEVL
jgi:hypothetical protein